MLNLYLIEYLLSLNTIATANPNPNLRFTSMRLQNRDNVCNSGRNYNGEMLESMICAIQQMGYICPTARGGGLYCNEQLTGVLSFGTECESWMRKPSVFLQVRTRHTLHSPKLLMKHFKIDDSIGAQLQKLD